MFSESRIRAFTLALLAASLLSACDFWPRQLAPLAESIAGQVSGETTAWLLGGDVLVINVSGSPLYREARPALEAAATGIAEQAVEHSPATLESIVITFYEREETDEAGEEREFIFLVTERGPVLQPLLDFDATGPLTGEEIRAAVDRYGQAGGEPEPFLTDDRRKCMLEEAEKMALAAGDPETLDAASLEYLDVNTWRKLDAFYRRIMLAQSITTKALFVCVGERQGLNEE